MKKRVVILGAGESGVGAAILAKTKGFQTFVSDMSQIKEIYREELDTYGIEWEESAHTITKILNADEIVKSPGIPDTAPIIQEAIARNIPIISEIEFAGRYTTAKMICITGSNGKTTTTSLLYHIFQNANRKVGLAGNIGKSLARQVALNYDFEFYIIELSSFQLDNMYDFKADISILLNITPDHLDRYEYKMENYIDAKFRITQNQTKAEHFIFWYDDPIIRAELFKRNLNATKHPFSLSQNAFATINGENIRIDGDNMILNISDIKLSGTHNQLNALAAISACYLAGLTSQEIKSGLHSFMGVEHRLEYVTTKENITYINDSKATNVDSCFYALGAMTSPTVLILGGKDKGNDYNQIRDLVLNKCRGLVFMGIDNSKLQQFFGEMGLPIADTNSMEQAIEAARAMAKSGDTILLSPCCASFDLFTSYENRGELFKKAVKEL